VDGSAGLFSSPEKRSLVLCLLPWGASDGLAHLRLAPRWLAVPALAALLARAALTARQLSYWGDNVTLWTHTIQVTGDDFVAPDNLGRALALEGKLDRPCRTFERRRKSIPSTRFPISISPPMSRSMAICAKA